MVVILHHVARCEYICMWSSGYTITPRLHLQLRGFITAKVCVIQSQTHTLDTVIWLIHWASLKTTAILGDLKYIQVKEEKRVPLSGAIKLLIQDLKAIIQIIIGNNSINYRSIVFCMYDRPAGNEPRAPGQRMNMTFMFLCLKSQNSIKNYKVT